MALVRSIALPVHATGGFDHGDVHLASGRVYVAHTATGSVEVIDGGRGVHCGTIPGCQEASGVLCAQTEGLVFAAARGSGKILLIEAGSGGLIGEVAVGAKPNGLAWDPTRRRLLVADVQDYKARVVDVSARLVIAEAMLPGRPRWCVYDPRGDRFLINIRDPGAVTVLSADMAHMTHWPISARGPHGLDLDVQRGQAHVACDEGQLITLDLETGRELARVQLAGEPDAIWCNDLRSRLYVAIAHPGVINVVDTENGRLAEEVPTEAGAHTTAFDRVRQLLYVFLPTSCRAAVYAEQ